MQTITSQELKTKIENKESFVVDFFATWCGPCKVLMNNIKIAEQKGLAAPVYTFDVDSDREFSVNELGIRSVPTVKYFKNISISCGLLTLFVVITSCSNVE